jgi:hypothetical protein
MAAAIASAWWIFASISALCAAYIAFKAKGGNLLFREKPTDDGSTKALKAVFALGWAYGSVMVALIVGVISFLLLLASGIAALVA